ncbi:MAG: hypothetical protein DA408_05785 [Bacteroidetes bacterium]|nr:MAG: hypothetical protein C7N36_08755 [Bacteroidota bacterium]PTM13643.1 MAG: hypothetical protein DA408_05785 [Bacteroidota bacterium]
MSLRKKVNLIIYRFRERGLEVFFLHDEQQEGRSFPQGEMDQTTTADHYNYISLDPVEEQDGSTEEAYAVEGDWHEIPSLKNMIYQDAVQLKEKLKSLEQGAFVSIKDALREAVPHQYAFLKELKDILRDRNSLRDL